MQKTARPSLEDITVREGFIFVEAWPDKYTDRDHKLLFIGCAIGCVLSLALHFAYHYFLWAV